jgi:hypothetical protein
MKTYILLGLAIFIANLSLAQNNRDKTEVFIQIEDRGNFTVQLDDDFIGSNKGKFRFYEVYSSGPTLSILQGNQKIYSKRLATHANMRLVLNFSVRSGLKVIKELNIYRNGQYALNDFDDYTGGYNTGIVPPRTDNRQNNFENLLAMVKRESFDDGKIKLIQVYAASNRLTTAQTASLLQSFMRDESKLIAIKQIFPVILDPQQVYTLKDSFTFNSGKEDFLNYLNSSSGIRENHIMDARSFEQLKAQVKREAFDDDKTKLIELATKQNKITTANVGELIKLYTFEDKALNLSKLIYPSVLDRHHYFTLKESFKFISHQNDFLDFLGRQ